MKKENVGKNRRNVEIRGHEANYVEALPVSHSYGVERVSERASERARERERERGGLGERKGGYLFSNKSLIVYLSVLT